MTASGAPRAAALTFADFQRMAAAHPSSKFELMDGVPWIVSQARRHHHVVREYLRYRSLTGTPAPRILDVGAFPGTLLKLLRVSLEERGFMAGLGLEGGDEFVDDLRHYDIEFRRANLDPIIRVDDPGVQGLPTWIPYDDASFDFTFCTEVLEHMLDPLACLREIFRVLSPRGCLLVTTPNLARAANRLKLMFWGASINFPLRESIMYNTGNWRPHIREYTLDELRQLFRDAGFTTLRDRYVDTSEDDVRLFGERAWRMRLLKGALKPFLLVPSWRHTILSVMRK
jgi:SAM-dependent methyltransferase